MKKNIFLGFKGEGKTPWLLDKMKEEAAAGKELYYLGGLVDYDKLAKKLKSLGCEAQLKHINKETNPSSDDCAIFTDELIFSLWNIWPNAVKNLSRLNGTWYITMAAEDFINLGVEEQAETPSK